MNASTKPILVNREQAERVAEIFMRHPHIRGVELFGRVAREGQGNDLDIILVTDVGTGIDFIRKCSMKLRRPNPLETKDMTLQRIDTYNNPVFRMDVAQEILNDNFRELVEEARLYISYCAELDIFVFPYTWRDGLDILQKDLPHRDPNFMQNIARDAVRIA